MPESQVTCSLIKLFQICPNFVAGISKYNNLERVLSHLNPFNLGFLLS